MMHGLLHASAFSPRSHVTAVLVADLMHQLSQSHMQVALTFRCLLVGVRPQANTVPKFTPQTTSTVATPVQSLVGRPLPSGTTPALPSHSLMCPLLSVLSSTALLLQHMAYTLTNARLCLIALMQKATPLPVLHHPASMLLHRGSTSCLHCHAAFPVWRPLSLCKSREEE